jgi:hypothetical protein
MDDEMIETRRADYFDAPSATNDQAARRDDYAQTEPMSAEDLKPFDFSGRNGVRHEEQAAENSSNDQSSESSKI